MDHPRPWLRYVDADDLDSADPSFDGMDVESASREKLGNVDGFIVDRDSGRPYYVVVDAGGWFKSKLFLLPIGHVAFDTNGNRLIADVTRERVERYPGFDRDEFENLSDEELGRMDTEMATACCPTEDRSTMGSRFDTWTHYQAPSWWNASYYRPDRADNRMRDIGSAGASRVEPARSEIRVEERDRDRELVTAKGGDVSPHVGGRAQPGDVLGVETGGEQTHIGDTAEDEDEWRRDGEKAAAKTNRD